MTLEQIIRRVAKMPAQGPDKDVVLAAREWVDCKEKEKASETIPRKVLQKETE